MATIPQFDPLTSEALSPFLAGLSEGLSRLSAILNLTTTTITDSAMSEVYIGESDRYRIYQVAAGNRLWLSDPAPVVKKNGTTITPVGANFTIDYIGGSIRFETTARLLSTDVVTVSATIINNASTEINDIKSDVTAVEAITAHFMGYYATLSDLQTAHTTGVDGDFAIIGGTVDSIYMWDSTGSSWKDIYKTVDLSTYYTKTESDALLAAKEASITAHGGTSASDLYYYGGRKTWQELTARVRATVLTGIDVATSAVVSATDTVLGAIGKLQAQITGKPFLSGTGDPTTATIGTIGQRYVNTSTGAVFRCTTIVDTTYTWVKQGSTSDLVDSNVTNAKLANMANNTIKGNVSGDAAAPSDLTVAQVRGIITEGTSEVDAIADGDKFVIEDVSAPAGARTKHVLWSVIKTALASVFAGVAHTHGSVTNDGKIGTTTNLPVFTGTGGLIGTKSPADAKIALNIATWNFGYYGRELPFTWAEIQQLIQAADFKDVRPGDYKDMTLNGSFYDAGGAATKTLSNAVFREEIAGIDSYYQYGDAAVPHHIDFISRDCMAGGLLYNTTDTNSGAFIGSALFTTLNNSTNGLVALLPADLAAVIIQKRGLTEIKTAATASSWAWNDMGKLWLPTEREVWGQDIWSEHNFGGGLAIQYPIFKDSLRHIIKGDGNGGGRCAWWCASSMAGSAAGFCFVDGNGIPVSASAILANVRVPLCFRIA